MRERKRICESGELERELNLGEGLDGAEDGAIGLAAELREICV